MSNLSPHFAEFGRIKLKIITVLETNFIGQLSWD